MKKIKSPEPEYRIVKHVFVKKTAQKRPEIET